MLQTKHSVHESLFQSMAVSKKASESHGLNLSQADIHNQKQHKNIILQSLFNRKKIIKNILKMQISDICVVLFYSSECLIKNALKKRCFKFCKLNLSQAQRIYSMFYNYFTTAQSIRNYCMHLSPIVHKGRTEVTEIES